MICLIKIRLSSMLFMEERVGERRGFLIFTEKINEDANA
jgi:hypothetical protein